MAWTGTWRWRSAGTARRRIRATSRPRFSSETFTPTSSASTAIIARQESGCARRPGREMFRHKPNWASCTTKVAAGSASERRPSSGLPRPPSGAMGAPSSFSHTSMRRAGRCPGTPPPRPAWYRRAAEGGNAEAQFHLGVMYREGDGVARDDVQAFALLDMAARERYVPIASAKAKRTELEREMTPSELREASAVRRELEARIESKRNGPGPVTPGRRRRAASLWRVWRVSRWRRADLAGVDADARDRTRRIHDNEGRWLVNG